MIIVDENLHDRRLIAAISAWYPGQVVSVITLRPWSVLKDDAIPTLLLKATQPTVVENRGGSLSPGTTGYAAF